MLPNTSCTAQHRISKQTVLAMLRSKTVVGPFVGDTVSYTDATGKTKQYRVASVSKNEVGLNTSSGVMMVDRLKVHTNDQDLFLDKLDLDQWSITSFDPDSRIVCIDVTTASGKNHVTVTLPALAN